tara:strand:+ start:1232 stop:1474 length:243 start_codon:yes stop_codon:yes gene_type:complete
MVERIDPATDSKLAVFDELDRSANLGKAKAASTPIITITNVSSIKVKPEFFCVDELLSLTLQPKGKEKVIFVGTMVRVIY